LTVSLQSGPKRVAVPIGAISSRGNAEHGMPRPIITSRLIGQRKQTRKKPARGVGNLASEAFKNDKKEIHTLAVHRSASPFKLFCASFAAPNWHFKSLYNYLPFFSQIGAADKAEGLLYPNWGILAQDAKNGRRPGDCRELSVVQPDRFR
jgi:hypothetical protein